MFNSPHIKLLPNAVYHLTDEQHISDILTNGLMLSDNRNIHLCTKENINKWSILLDRHILLRIKDADFTNTEIDTLSANASICPENIELSTDKLIPSDEDRIYLCAEYIMKLSMFIKNCFDCYINKKLTPNVLRNIANHLAKFLPRLPYKQEDSECWQELLEFADLNDEPTFCDICDDHMTRLWEKLPQYPQDLLSSSYKIIYDFINSTFPFAKTLTTGMNTN